MAQIKFNRGLRTNMLSNTNDDIAFISDIGTDWNSIYLGKLLVGTSLLGLMIPSKLKTKTTDSATSWSEVIMGTESGYLSSVVITADMNGTSAITTCRKLVDSDGVRQDGYSPGDNEMLTAKAVKTIAESSASAASVNTWYISGTFNTTNWSWTATEQGGQNHGNLTFTLPVESDNIVLHGTSPDQDYSNELLPTSKAVATFVEDYFAGLAGAMEYKGGLTTAMYTTHPAYKPGDVFIAQNENGTLGIEVGDMVIVNTAMAANAEFVTKGDDKNCDVFERNLDGAVTTASTLNAGKLIVGNGTKTIKTLETTAGGLVYSSTTNNIVNLPIGTAGQHLIVSSSKPAWDDSIYYKVALKPNTSSGGVTTYHDDTLVITQNKNGQDQTSAAVELQINHVAEATHAASADSADSATNATYVGMSEASENSAVPILVRGAQNSNTTNYGVKYDSQVTVNPSTNTLAATEVALTQSSTTINVFDTLTWHTLGS